MRIRSTLTIGNRVYAKGDEIPWTRIYPFFLLHMLVFGGSGFFMAYGTKHVPLVFLYAHGGFAILIYSVFYCAIFGVDEVKWMLINAGLGVVGIYAQIGWLLSLFGKRIEDYPIRVQVIPFLYFVLYTFLLRHAVLDLTGSRDDAPRKKSVEYAYIAGSLLISAVAWWWDWRGAKL
ncbi:MAG TPA: hypothetical protein VHD32_13070 [Candidatus Didemnitutus sp.]|nr:hypothetical protein [Candidatus Didemnitutus sp.]